MCEPPNLQRVMVYGLDVDLLETRRLLLAQAGYATELATTREEFEAKMRGKTPRYKLLVLCHTVPAEEQARVEVVASRVEVHVYRMPLLTAPSEFLSRVAELVS